MSDPPSGGDGVVVPSPGGVSLSPSMNDELQPFDIESSDSMSAHMYCTQLNGLCRQAQCTDTFHILIQSCPRSLNPGLKD